MTAPQRPVCRYFGGKWKLADWIIEYFPEHRCYIELFGGAGSVLMKKKPSRIEVYNDLSDEMTNLFRVLRDPKSASQLRRLLYLTPYSRTEFEACYDLVDDPIEQARRTIVLATMSHNPSKVMNRLPNGFRTSTSGYHRMPQDFRGLTDNLLLVTKRLQQVLIENRNALDLISQHDDLETLFYADPPYLGELRTDKRNCYQHEMFTEDDHRKFAAALHEVKGYVVLSGYDHELYRELFDDWRMYSKQAVTGAAKKGKSSRTEVLWLNPRAASQARQLQLL